MSESTVSLILSGLALAVSCVATVLSWRSHRRQGALVSTELLIREPVLVAEGTQLVTGSATVTLRNEGLASVGVSSMLWIIEGPEYTTVALIDPQEGPSVPLTLAGLHSADWHYTLETIQAKVEFSAARARVLFKVGADQEITTPWREVPAGSASDLENKPLDGKRRQAITKPRNSKKKSAKDRRRS